MTPTNEPPSTHLPDRGTDDNSRAWQKVFTLEDLGRRADAYRQEGKSVVLAHGVFDLVHMGHIRHLEGARREGDVLFVTVTADAYVNKGPGRPIFSQEMRAEMLAAIGCVDAVGINHGESAEHVLEAIRPDVYVKGSDYENPEDDVTGKISKEKAAVESHGGRLVITKDITFSSSSLINKYLDVYDRPLQDYLESMRPSNPIDRLTSLIDSVSDKRVLIVGDAIIDEYQYVVPMGKAAKENIIATRFQETELFAGGVFAVANTVSNFCAEVEILTCLGEYDDHEDFIRAHLKPNVKMTCVRRAGAPTTRKLRHINPSYMRKLFEVYFFEDSPLPAPLQQEFNDLVAARAGNYDMVIASDFGHGLISPSTIEVLLDKSRFLAANTQTNSANLGYNLITKFRKADFVCIDAPEAQLASRDKFSPVEVIAAEKLPKMIDCDRFVITHGREGCVAYENGKGLTIIPAFTKTVVDTVGAGDAFLAVTAPLAAAGARIEDIGFIGNAAGAMKVGILGHRGYIEKIPLMRYITTLLK
ncbi:MAG: PfkB family carbohydrate kinase [Rhodospirillales bacterium]